MASARPASKEENVIINISLGADKEARRIFVGFGDRQFQIERGKDVAVPRGVMEILDNAIIGVPEIDEQDPEKVVMVQRKRFPYTVIGTIAQ